MIYFSLDSYAPSYTERPLEPTRMGRDIFSCLEAASLPFTMAMEIIRYALISCGMWSTRYLFRTERVGCFICVYDLWLEAVVVRWLLCGIVRPRCI